MLIHARRAVPWSLVLITSLLVVTMLAIVGQWPWTMWPLQGVAVAMLAGTAARCLDEPSPEIADAAPRHLRWRGAAQGLGVVVLLAAWTVGVLTVGGELFGRRGDVLAQGFAAVAATLGVTAWLRSRGLGRPGRLLALYLVPLIICFALARPLPERLPIFPYTPAGPWAASRVLWAGVAVAGLAALVTALADARWHQAARTTRRDATREPRRSPRPGW